MPEHDIEIGQIRKITAMIDAPGLPRQLSGRTVDGMGVQQKLHSDLEPGTTVMVLDTDNDYTEVKCTASDNRFHCKTAELAANSIAMPQPR